MDALYYVIRESRPHTNAPQIIRVRYLREDGGLEAQFEAAGKFSDVTDAYRAAAHHMKRICADNPPAPPGTTVKVIECDFKTKCTLTVDENGD